MSVSSSIPSREELLHSALSAAPQHSANAAHAWRLYGDWLYGQHDMADVVAAVATHSASLCGRPPNRLRAAEAYCQAARIAAGSALEGCSMSALLRVLQACVL